MKDADYWIKQFDLQEHPEGGYYREMYRSDEIIGHGGLPERFGADRNMATSIYFMLKSEQVNTLHRIKSDELWHFYAGAPLLVHMIHPDGVYESLHMGDNPEAGQSFVAHVPAGSWFAAQVPGQNKYALVGCTVAPGFDFADLDMAERAELLQQFPQHSQLIESLTHPAPPRT